MAAALGLAGLPDSPDVAAAQAPDASVARPDYGDPRLWLCLPDLENTPCDTPLDATIIEANGTTSVEPFRPARTPPIDCFYVYPTVSNDETWQSDFLVDQAEGDAIRLQFARFGQVCRLFAPIYRQGTLRRLRVAAGGPPPVGEPLPAGVGGYADIRAAWDWYMARENRGRGVVLIGHSQGGAVITRLMVEAIDGKPAQVQLVSVLILGAPVMVPASADVGGSFAHVPLCRARTQTGCVITYASFRDTRPPPPDSVFGRARDGLRVACVNPASLTGGSGVPRPYFLTGGLLNRSSGLRMPDWLVPPRPVTTPFVSTPGLVTTECREEGEFNWLSVQVNADPTDPRTDDIAGEIVRATGPDLAWGLHLIDMDHSIGTLIEIVNDQADAYLRRSPPCRCTSAPPDGRSPR